MNEFLQAMDGQSLKQQCETTKLCERFSKLRDQLVDANARQTELVESHERLQMTWCDATSELAMKHTEDLNSLLEKHLQVHTATSTKKREQLVQFVGAHEEARKRLDGGCKALEEGFRTQLSSTKSKIELISTLGKDVICEATAASNKHLQDIETYMKKRKVSTCSVPRFCTV